MGYDANHESVVGRRGAAVLAALLLAASVSASGQAAATAVRERATADAANRFVIRITGPAQSVSTTSCFLRLRARVVGGGIMRYCVEAFHGRPGADATVRDRGTMTFVLPDGTLRAAVRITQRFAADGRHARQHLHGTLVGGGGRFRNARGSIVGGGTDVEHPPGQVVSSRLRYVVDLR